jgi:hypothetical protein
MPESRATAPYWLLLRSRVAIPSPTLNSAIEIALNERQDWIAPRGRIRVHENAAGGSISLLIAVSTAPQTQDVLPSDTTT